MINIVHILVAITKYTLTIIGNLIICETSSHKSHIKFIVQNRLIAIGNHGRLKELIASKTRKHTMHTLIVDSLLSNITTGKNTTIHISIKIDIMIAIGRKTSAGNITLKVNAVRATGNRSDSIARLVENRIDGNDLPGRLSTGNGTHHAKGARSNTITRNDSLIVRSTCISILFKNLLLMNSLGKVLYSLTGSCSNGSTFLRLGIGSGEIITLVKYRRFTNRKSKLST